MTGLNRRVYEFKGFRLDGPQHRLLRDGQPVPLKAKVFDVLLFLVERRGQLVEKDELMREIWPNTIVEESNITVSVSVLRKILGDDRAGREFIETVPRLGYRFVAEVTQICDAETIGGVSSLTRTESVEAQQDLPIDSLAILPIQNSSKDGSGEYLCDGIAESIINSLSQVPNLRVMAFSAVMRFKVATDRPARGRHVAQCPRSYVDSGYSVG